MSVGEATALIVALTGVASLVLAHRLGLIGQKKDAQAQAATDRLQTRIASFDELESINDRLTTEIAGLRTENAHLRALVNEAETRGDVRLAAQARRCRERIDDLTNSMVTLQSVVVSEIASASAQHSIDLAKRHVDEDHSDEQPDLS